MRARFSAMIAFSIVMLTAGTVNSRAQSVGEADGATNRQNGFVDTGKVPVMSEVDLVLNDSKTRKVLFLRGCGKHENCKPLKGQIINGRKIEEGQLTSGKLIDLSKPEYPPIAKAAHASGIVIVQVIIDEEGKIVAAHAVSGHPLLQAAAVKAAQEARFSPTLLDGEAVAVTGTINYNFKL